MPKMLNYYSLGHLSFCIPGMIDFQWFTMRYQMEECLYTLLTRCRGCLPWKWNLREKFRLQLKSITNVGHVSTSMQWSVIHVGLFKQKWTVVGRPETNSISCQRTFSWPWHGNVNSEKKMTFTKKEKRQTKLEHWVVDLWIRDLRLWVLWFIYHIRPNNHIQYWSFEQLHLCV